MRHSFLSRALLALALFVAGGCTAAASSPPSTAATIAASTASGPFGFGFPAKHKSIVTEPTGGGLANVYDARYGTNTAQSAIDGWFTFTPSAGVPIYYVDSGIGNDSNNCTSYTTPCLTFDAAFTKFDAAFAAGAHLRVAGKRATPYVTTLRFPNMAGKSGISATYPTVIESYDPTDPTNAAKYGRLQGSDQPVVQLGGTHFDLGEAFHNETADAASNQAFQGLTFDGLDQDGPGLTFQNGAHNNIIFQNDKFIGLQLTLNSGASYDVTAASYTQGGNFSKNAFVGGYASGSNMQCAYVHGTNGVHIEDNVWAHCGWRIGSARTDNGPNGGANGVNHAHYIGATDAGVVLARNFYVDSSYDGQNLRGNGTVASAASLDEPLAGSMGSFSSSFKEAPDGVTQQVTDWMIAGGAPITTGGIASAVFNTNTLSGTTLTNVAAFDNPQPGVFISSDTGTNAFNTVTLTHSGTTATLTTSTPHRMVTGDTIIVDGASPSDYNVFRVPVTVIDPSTVTYTMATTPATNATVLGHYMPTIPQYLLINKVHAYNYSSSWENLSWIPNQIHNTYTNIVSDQLATGAGNSTSSAGTFTGYKTRDQVITAVLTGIGVTPGATYYARKAQLIDRALENPSLPWAQWLIGVSFPAMNLTPTYTTPAYTTFTDTPLTIYKATLANLTLSTLNFTKGTSATALLTGVGALPVLSSSSLPSGFTLAGRVVSYDGTGTGAAAPSVTIRETAQGDTSTFHDTTFTFNITAPGGSANLTSPTASGTSTPNASLGVTTDTAGGQTLYWEVCTTATAPSAAQVKLGQDSSGTACAASGNQIVSATGVQSATASTGLTAKKIYYAYYVQHGTADSNVASSPMFVTGTLSAEKVNDGTFTSGANWTMGANESVSSNTAHFTGATSFFWQNNAGIVAGHTYLVTFTLSNYSAGQIRPYLGSAITVGTNRASNGTFTEIITPSGGGELGLNPANAFAGDITNFSVKEVSFLFPGLLVVPVGRRRRKRKAANDNGELKLAA